MPTGCSETKEAKAKVLGLTYNPLTGHEWSVKAWYEYQVEVQKFIDTIYFYENDIIPNEGKEFTVIYEVDNPAKNRIKD